MTLSCLSLHLLTKTFTIIGQKICLNRQQKFYSKITIIRTQIVQQYWIYAPNPTVTNRRENSLQNNNSLMATDCTYCNRVLMIIFQQWQNLRRTN